MNDHHRTRTLLLEAHSYIAQASQEAVRRIGLSLRRKPYPTDTSKLGAADRKRVAAISDALSKMTLNYPPEAQVLTPPEERALRAMKLTATEQNALRKLIAEACHASMFSFFCLMDAVGHPYVVDCRTWLGARFAARGEGPMLHDEFGDLYWQYKDATLRSPASGRKKRTAKAKPKRR
jgi:hypothetical protein